MFLFVKNRVDVPIPAPRYNTPAQSVGGKEDNKTFENGEENEYNNAAKSAKNDAFKVLSIKIV